MVTVAALFEQLIVLRRRGTTWAGDLSITTYVPHKGEKKLVFALNQIPQYELNYVACLILNLFYQSSFENNQKRVVMYVKQFSLIFLFLPIILAFPQKLPVEVRQGLFATHLCKFQYWFSLDTLIFPILESFVVLI